MNTIKAIKLVEDMFPKTFTNYIEKDFGVLFYNQSNRNSYDSNHALIYKSKITDLDSVLDYITHFYISRNLNPNIYQAVEDEGYFKENEVIFNRHGYKVVIEGPNNYMILTGENNTKSSNQLDIKLVTEWDERIATDICIPSSEEHEIEVMKKSISNNNYKVFVGYVESNAVAITCFHSSEYDCCRFDYILISKDFRNKGYARELLSYVTDYCRENNLKNCFQWPAHKTSERICYEAGFRHLFSAEAGRASYNPEISKALTMNKEVIYHYNCLIDENNDPVHDPLPLQKYMDKWDGQDFIDDLNLAPEKSVLEIGVGTGRLAVKVCAYCYQFTGIDISDKTILRAAENMKHFKNKHLICADFMSYSFDEKFDIIYSSLTFMHIKNKEKAINKIASLLSDSGRFVLSIEKTDSNVIKYGNRKIHTYPDSPDGIIKYLENSNLHITKQYETEFATILITDRY